MPTVVVTETISTHYIDASGNTYSVEVSYGPEAGIPSGAKLAVSELEGDAAEAYYNEALKAVENDGNNGENAGNNKKTTLKYAKALDISILKDGVEVHPVAPVSVSIKLLDAPSTDEFDEANVVHFGDEVELVDCNVQREAVGFETDAFSVYVVTYTLSTFYMDAAGNTFNIEVEYDREAGIPEGAGLRVSELEGDVAGTYAAQAAEALNVASSQLAYAKALDIAIVKDGAEVQIQSPVKVSVKLLDAPEVDENTSVNVLHFGDEVEPVSCAFDGDAVAFEADGFSVYVVTFTRQVENQNYTYEANAGSSLMLSELLAELGADVNVSDVQEVEAAGSVQAEPNAENSDWIISIGSEPTEVNSSLTLRMNNADTITINVTFREKVTVTITEQSEEVDYDGQEHVVTGYVVFIDNDNYTESDFTFSGTASASGTDAGSYDMELTTADFANVNDGFDVTFVIVDGGLVINPINAIVTADEKSKNYGDDDPELTATVTGLVGEDTVTYTLAREEGTDAGAYAITPSGEAIQGNYAVTYVPGVFSVETRNLTVTAASESKVYDGYVLSNDGYTPEGLVTGDEITSALVEGSQTDVGKSPNVARDAKIANASGDDVTQNYAITYVPGTLTVTPKPITITADSAEKVYDGTALTANGYTSAGLADGDVFDGVTVTGSQTLVGNSANTPSGAKIVRPTEGDTVVDVNDNYNITYANGILTVTRRPLVIIADSAEKGYDGKPLTKNSYTVDGLAEGDSVQDVTVTGSQTDAGISDNVPKDAVIVNGDGAVVTDDYDIEYRKGTLEVTNMTVKLTAASGVKVYDGAEKTVSGFTVSADGRTLEGVVFAESVSASGSGTDIGSYGVTFTGITEGVTTDTTGNYLVTETENGKLQIVENAPLEKRLSAFNGNVAEYEITINPDRLVLNGGNVLTLKDTFTSNQSIDYNSVTSSSASVTYDYSGWTGTFTIPDETAVTITYKTRVSGAAGTEATFGNTAQLGVMQDGSFAPWYSKTVTETRTLAPSGSDIEGSDGVYTLRLFAYVQDHMEQGLGGAVFRLLDANQRPIAYRAGALAGEQVTFTTGGDGYATVKLDDGIVSIRKNTVYYLEMTTAPVAESGGSYTYYQKDNTLYRFLITDDPSYSGEYSYFNGDVLKVRCYPEAAGVNVTKRFSGNFSLTDEQKNSIRFVLQKEDLASGEWVDVESHSYAEFSYGTMNFTTGREGGQPLEQAVLYRVIEQVGEIEGIDQSSSVTLTYQSDGETIQEPNNNEFEVNPDHNTYSFSLVFDNTYVDHKLTLVKMNELTGEVLPGAEFTVHSASDDAEVKTYTTDENGAVDIRRGDEGADYAFDTAYYVVESNPPMGYLEPKAPEKIYFYFSENGSGVPGGIPSGVTAVDLTTSYDTVTIDNQTETVKVPVTVTWDVDGEKSWPGAVESVTVSLYQSVNGEEPVQVERGGAPMTVTLSSAKTFDNTTFVDLPARDAQDNDITYSVAQDTMPDYYTSYKVSGTGWYVVKNEAAVSVTVEKEWYGLDKIKLSDASDKGAVKFDLYRTTGVDTAITTRDALEERLRGEEPVRTGLELSAPGWTNTVTSLQKQDADGNTYFYFALEREDSMPRNNEDSYAIAPAGEGALRTLTIKNTQTPITVIVRANDLSKAYGQDDPDFDFDTEVQDDEWNVGEPVKAEDGSYAVEVTKGEETKRITFTCSREDGEDVGSYAIELNGEDRQAGFRVRLDDGTLTITPAQVTVKGTATKVYGDPDPKLVEITGMKEGDTIAYYAYRDIGEQKGSYRITVTGLAKQGNYEITYVNDYLTITPAPVTVTADDISKAYGQADPTLTVTIDGLKNRDAASVIKYTIGREAGESVREYPITVAGDAAQGNYTVTFVPGTFTITGHKVTVKAKNLRKTYGDADPVWEAEVTGQLPDEDIEYSFTREAGEDVGEYVVTPVGETAQGNAEVTFEPGVLSIDRAPLTITPVNIIKALTDPVTQDPRLTVSFDKLVNHDDEIVPDVAYNEGTRTWTYTYTREGKDKPEFAFTVTRTPGETAGPYIIAASAYGDRAQNYSITYKTGIFTILTTYNVVVNQQTRDLVDYTQNPEYSYRAVLDTRGIGIESYNGGGFENNEMTFALPADGSSSKTLLIPAGVKLTVTQASANPDYTTAITLDSKDVEGTEVEINPVNKASVIAVIHERITLPVEARASQRQTEDGKADEDGAVAVTPLAYLGIPRDADGNPISQSAENFIADLDAQGVYNLPEDRYYVPEHASVYNGNTAVAQNVQAIRYDAENKVWQYSTDGERFTGFNDGEQLVLFYMPKYICRVQADGESFYTLNDALKHIDELTPDETDDEGKVKKLGNGMIEMLIDRYTMPAADALTVPKNFDITLSTAGELESPATILRKPNNLGHMFTNDGALTLGSITLDGNKSRVTANDAMVLNSGTLTVSGSATLQNASGNNGGAIYAKGGNGRVTVAEDAAFTGNQALNGGAIYLNEGSLSIATDGITGNRATNGGGVYVAGGVLDMAIQMTGNSATSGGAVYISGGKVNVTGGTVSGTATSGGAVFMIGGTVNVTGGTVSGSMAENGGAFYMEDGTLNISGGTVKENTAQQNGGMLYATGGSINISGGTLSENTANNGNGGAISYNGSGAVTISGGTLSGNKAESGLGGAIYQSSGEATLSAGYINGGNTAKNGAAVYTAGGITNFRGVSITGNIASEGGAVGMAAGTKLNFSGNTMVSGNTNTANETRNVYLNVDSDEVINVPADLGSNNIGIYVADNVRSTRGEVCCSFSSYVSTTNLARIIDDRGIYTEYNYNNKLYWGKPVKFWVRYLPNGNGFPPNTTSGNQLYEGPSYYPKSAENQIYTLVNLLYDTYYSDKIKTGYVYAYTYRNGETSFDKYVTAIDWDAEARQWVYKLHDGTTYTTDNNAQIVIYYADSAYISIVNNSGYDLTIDPLTVMGKTAVGNGYGYTAVINNVTQKTLLPITGANLTIPKDCSVRLLFPGAKGSAWSLNGTFGAAAGSTIQYTLDRAGGGTAQTLPTTATEGALAFSLNGNLLSTAGGIYEILFGEPTPICKVENGGVEHPFTSLNLAKDYIVSNGLTTAKIEMLLDYQQPKSDILAIPEGYNITLTTAVAADSEAAAGKTYTYVGDNPTRATISRSSGDMGAAVTSEIQASTAVLTNDACTTSLTVDGIIFDGKALGQGGEGGAVKTANTIVNIKNCDFQGYTAKRGGALYVKWGRLTVEDSNFTNCKILSNQDKTGGGGIWTTAHDLTVKNCNFISCDCTQYPKNNSAPQGGAIFHNIRDDKNSDRSKRVVHPEDSQEFPAGFSKDSTTRIEGCTFKDCIATGSGGTVESDAWLVDVENCTFHGGQTTKSGGNGGALNIYTNDSTNIDNSTYLNVINCWFEDCSATNGNTNGGAVRTLCKSVKVSGTTFINAFSNNTGGALSMTNTGTKLEIYGCTFDDCRANESSGAVYAKATTLTVGDSESYMDYNAETGKYEVVSGSRHTTFTDCTSKKYGGIYHDQTGDATITGATFTRCTTTNESAGALYTKTKKLFIKDTSFVDCSATKDGGAVYNKDGTSQTITDCVFDSCSSATNGGGAYLAATELEVSNTKVQNCEAVNNGGGIYTGTGGTGATFTGCTFTNNRVTASGGKGGALYHNSNGLTINGENTVEKNRAAYGGGIYHNGTAFNLNSGTRISECSATISGGGIYHYNGTFHINGAQISECYAATSGGAIYSRNNLYAYGTIENCAAGQGGGIYSESKLYLTDTANAMTIENCQAKNVALDEDGSVTVAEDFSADNLGGGIYKKSDLFDMKSDVVTVKGCSAYNGGGVYYNSAGTMTFSAGNFYGNTAANNGGAIYKNAGTLNMTGGVVGGSTENANHAQYGAGIFVADGQKITIGGGRITHNVAEVGGAVAVGGSNANTQLLFQGAPVIKYNTMADGTRCNVYLNYDAISIIRTSGNVLTAGAYIGVYVNDEQFTRHGDYGMPFGTYNKTDLLSSFSNDRIYAGGKQGSSSQIVWSEYVCKITDADGNLLYIDAACEAPAVYTTLENDGNENTSSAFGKLSYASPNLYGANGEIYEGPYQIQMLVGDYYCASKMQIKNGVKDITLTTASRTPDECGFYYNGVADQATIHRNATYVSMINTNNMSRLAIENITIDGGSENGWKSSDYGGIIYLTGGTAVYLNQNTILRNSDSQGKHGAAVYMSDNASNRLEVNGADIEKCVNTASGGGICAINGTISMTDGQITGCSAKSGGGIFLENKASLSMSMSGGSITGNSATAEAGGIDLKKEIHLSGNPVISGNTLNGNPCNLHLINDNNTSIYADGLGPFAEIRVYTTSGNVRNRHGVDGMPFGTWTDDANLHCFINDLNVNLRGMKTADDKLIYWRTNPFLTVGKNVDSDWAEDNKAEFDFTVTLVGQDTFSGTYGDMTFTNGTTTFQLKDGQFKTASDLPFDFIHSGVEYTVTETVADGHAYTTQYSHNGGTAMTGTSVTGHFGENMSEDQTKSSSVSRVEFTNTRTTDDLTVSKTVTEGIGNDNVTPYAFTVTLDDNTITKDYDAKRYQNQTDQTGTDETVSFINGVGTFQLTHGQSIKILDLPTELGFKIEEKLTEDQYANFRTYVTAGSAEEILSYSASGTIGALKNVAFRNNRYGLVCKIVNDTPGREQLYYRENNDPTADPTPAIFDELEKAFETISNGTSFFTADGASADDKLRIEMVKSHYAMTRQATLAVGHNVTLGTAQKTDPLYPYPSDAVMPAVVSRGENTEPPFLGSMIVDNGNLTLDDITLDGGSEEGFTANENGGIVRVNGARTLTLTENATLRNSNTSGNGGAVWIGKTAALVMNGVIRNCEASNGGGVYAKDGFGGGMTGAVGVTVGGTISVCTATAGNGGALNVGEAADIIGEAPVILTGSAALTGNRAVSVEGEDNTGRGGAIHCATDVEINSGNVAISGNTARKDGGGIFQSSESTFTMTGGTISNNTAETGNAGGIWANDITITGGSFSGNAANGTTDGEGKTVNGKGGAIYTKTGASVSITGTTLEGNQAYQGGAVYDQAATFTVTNATMTGNTAIKNGGAVYVSSKQTDNGAVKTGSFDMTGGTITGNQSPEGAVSTGSGAELNFSGDVTVNGNTATDGATAMNVCLGYHSNTIINASGFTGTGLIGVYVKDGEKNLIYNNHGIANRPFGTGSGENLNKFVNDRDNSLKGMQGPDGLIMWPGEDLVLQVYQNKLNDQGKKTTPVGGAKFSLANEDGVTTWSGESNRSTGLVTIPWGINETENGDTATFTKKAADGYVAPATYVLTQTEANGDTVLPAGSWRLTVDVDNRVTWAVILPEDEAGQQLTEVNRIINVEASEAPAYLGDSFTLYDDVKPTITFDPNGGKLSGKNDTESRTDTIDFSTTELNHTYTIEESNPTKDNAVFRVWSTVENPVEGDGHVEYKLGDTRLFYRNSDNDDVTLYALWSSVVCKITDRNDNLLYVNGSPAVYMSLKEGFDAFNDAEFTFNGVKATPRKIKMLVPDYEMTETVGLARGKIAEFTTASENDNDGYKGPGKTCVITRAASFDTGSMIVDNYSLTLRDIVLDGAVKDGSGNVNPIEGNGGIVTVIGNASNLTLALGVVLRNATVSGNGGAIYAEGDNTTVTVSTGSSITGCQAANGGAIYGAETVNISGGELSDNKAVGTTVTGDEAEQVINGQGGAVYTTGKVSMTRGSLTGNAAEADGGALYMADASAVFSMTGGTVSGNSAVNGGGVYSDGEVRIENKAAVISSNTATGNGGGVYVGAAGSFALSAGSVGAKDAPNKAADGSGVYLAGSATLTGGSIAYNGTANVGNGGGLYITGAQDITLNGTEISNNIAANGGGIYAASPAGEEGESEREVTLTLAKGTVSNNNASQNGGGIYMSVNVNASMIGGTLGGGNEASLGGGAYVQGSFELNGGSVTANTATINGGAVYVAEGATMTLTKGTVANNTATANGGAIYVEAESDTAYGSLRIASGTVSGNSATGLGGAVYLEDYARMRVLDGTVSQNTADGTDGGAVNVAGGNARIYLSGSPTIFHNPGNAATTTQKNLVLSEDSSTIINTGEDGMTGGTVGIYVVDGQTTAHGLYNTPFGTFGGSITENRENAKYLVNDRDLALYGVAKDDNTIYWLDVVCKVANDSDVMLYKYITVNGTSTRVYASAVYPTLEEGMSAVAGSLYKKSGSRYATANTGAVKVKMLRDYDLDAEEIITYATARDLTLTTAETAVSFAMQNNGDAFVYKPAQGATGDNLTKATLTRAQRIASMFTVNTVKNKFNVSDIIIDGGSNTMLNAADVNGGAFNIQSVGASTFSGATLKNLNATGDGGAIYLKAGRLTISSGTIEDSKATDGGAVYVDGGSFTMNGSAIITECAATNGGAIYSKGALLLDGSAQVGQAKKANAALNGGGLYVNGGRANVQGNASIQYNTASSGDSEQAAENNGAGIYLNAGSLSIAGNAGVGHNEALGRGGALYTAGGTVNISGNCSLSDNIARNSEGGGGMYVYQSTLTMTGGMISGNRVLNASGEVHGQGGGVRLANGGATFTLSGGAITNNEAASGGGVGMFNDSTMTMTGGTISGNRATNGGGVYSDNSATLNLQDGNIAGNTAETNGGGVYQAGGTFTMAGGTIGGTANRAIDGAGIYVASGSTAVSGGSITGNTATQNGGGVYNAAGVFALSGDGSITGNMATGNGGGVYQNSTGIEATETDPAVPGFTVSGGSIAGNTASGNGGGVYNAGGTLTMTDGTIGGTANNAVDGAGIYVAAGSVGVSGGSITGNTATGNGGGVYNGSTGIEATETAPAVPGVTLSGGSITNNTATGNGGAVFAANGATVTLKEGTTGEGDSAKTTTPAFTGNSAKLGGAVYVSNGGILNMSAGQITGNSASDANGGAINVGGVDARLNFSGNPVVYGNPATNGQQKNVVLSVDSNEVINTNETGLTGGTIGVYVIDGEKTYDEHGIQDKPFGTFGDAGHANPQVFVNDRDLALYAVSKSATDTNIYWVPIVCKLTDGSNNLLYTQRNINGQDVKVAAVYPHLEGTDASTCGLAAAEGTLYPYGSTTAYTGNAIQVKMLCDYELPASASVTGARAVTLTTAETTTDGNAYMATNGDSYTFAPTFTADKGRAATDSAITAIIRRKTAFADASMFAKAGSAEFTVTNIILDSGSVQTAVNGGIVNVAAGKLTIVDGATLRNASVTGNGIATGNGGAVYVDNGATVEITGGEITGNAATNGGAVYVANGATMALKDGTTGTGATAKTTSATINGNTATANGAGIYLDYDDVAKKGATLNLEGSPSFGGTGRAAAEADSAIISEDSDGKPIGNFVNIALAEGAQNGQKEYVKFRQDIYMAGYQGTVGTGTTPKPATSIVVTGAITSDAGSIWVAAEKPDTSAADAIKENNHYEMLKQFAVFADGVASDETTVQAFRNAWDDENTGCGADYLTGQDGDDLTDDADKTWACIYWTGGFDFVFRKIKEDGQPLDGATFTLFMAVEDPDNSGSFVPAMKDSNGKLIKATSTDETTWAAYEQTDKVKGGKVDATAVSTNITAANAVKVKYTANGGENVEEVSAYGDGLAVFEKIPPGVYFMVEKVRTKKTGGGYDITTGAPKVDGKAVDYQAVEEMYRVVIDGKGWYAIHVAKRNATTGQPEWDDAVKNGKLYTWPNAKNAPTVKLTETANESRAYTDQGTGTATIDLFTALNVSPLQRKVILKKVDGDKAPLNGAVFTVLYADKETPVRVENGKDASGKPKYEILEDKTSGAGGAFWIGKLPYGTYYLNETKNASGTAVDIWFILAVNEDGVGYLEADAKEGEKPVNTLNPEKTKP